MVYVSVTIPLQPIIDKAGRLILRKIREAGLLPEEIGRK
jgi:hypothetical protein